MLKFENKDNGRYYYIITHRDILNDYVLTILRGGHRNNVVKHYGYNNLTNLIEEVDKLSKRRLKRGYTLISQ